MAGYTKLFNSILASTIWGEPMPTRIVWITLLAMVNKDGIVEGSAPGLATLARVSLQQAREALHALQQPDPDSRSKTDEGRRIRTVDGGWFIINHGEYRKRLSQDERREYLRLKQAEYRARKQASTPVNNVSDKSTLYTHTDPDTDPDTKAKRQDQDPPVRAPRSLTPTDPEFLTFWHRYPKKTGKGAAYKAWVKCKPSLEAVISALEWQTQQPDWLRDQGQYIPHPATWLNRAGWEDEAFNPPSYQPPVLAKPGRGARVLQAARDVIAKQLEKQRGLTDGTERGRTSGDHGGTRDDGPPETSGGSR